MSLYDILIKDSYDEHSFPDDEVIILGETMQKLQFTKCTDTFKLLYSKFNNYSLELTISPKSSTLLRKDACCACGATSLRDVIDQIQIMETLFEKLIKNYNINILGVYELYGDGHNVHCHAIINNQDERIIRLMKNYIKNYYKLNNKNIINLSPIRNKDNYLKYLLKEQNSNHSSDSLNHMFYYDENDENEIEYYEKEVFQKKINKKNLCECDIKICSYCKDCSL